MIRHPNSLDRTRVGALDVPEGVHVAARERNNHFIQQSVQIRQRQPRDAILSHRNAAAEVAQDGRQVGAD